MADRYSALNFPSSCPGFESHYNQYLDVFLGLPGQSLNPRSCLLLANWLPPAGGVVNTFKSFLYYVFMITWVECMLTS